MVRRNTRRLHLLVTVASVAVVYAVVSAASVAPFRPEYGVAVFLGIGLGPAAALGAALGQVLHDSVVGSLGTSTVFAVTAALLTALVGYAVWGKVVASSDTPPDFRDGKGAQFAEYAVVVLTGTALSASVVGWGAEVLGNATFSVAAVPVFVGAVIASAVGPPFLYLLSYVAEKGTKAEHANGEVMQRQAHVAATGVVLVSLSWFVGGVGFAVFIEDAPLFAADATGATEGGSTVLVDNGVVSLLFVVALLFLSVRRLPWARRSADGDTKN